MMNDRELMELAAKAHGALEHDDDYGWTDPSKDTPTQRWSPLTDDGDALRLANKLHLCACHTLGGVVGAHGTAMVGMSPWENSAPLATERYEGDGDICAATRRAIVRAAAEIGKAMP